MSLSLLWGFAQAQDSEPYTADPPDRAARLSYISGNVSLQPVGEEEWAPALVNRPLTTGDKLWTERNARAEIYVGPAAVRLDDETAFSFLNVDDDTIQMRVTAGVINVTVRNLDDREHIEIDTPNVALSLLRAGSYRVEVNDAGDSTVVKVREGQLQATGPSQDTVLYAEQAVTFIGTDDLVARHTAPGAPDDFDSWSFDRDRADERAASSETAEYVSPQVTGYQDLNDNGSWSSEPEYGYVWTPRYVGVDWAPYRYGRWVTVAPWGYTWIDDAPWGYAPFHYGRWAHIRQRWCWVPGPRHARAVYAPALVGWGGHSGGNVAWFPLGPREVYVPGHRYSRRYVERVNIANTIVSRAYLSQVYDHGARDPNYRNRVVPGGVTAVSRAAFASAGRTANHRVRISDQELARSPTSAYAPRIVAGRESRLGAPARANMRVPPRSVADRQVVVRHEPPAAAARFARRPAENRDVTRPAARVARAPDPVATLRERADRPTRAELPAREAAPPTQSSVFDRNALANRVRQDRDRQVREGQQRRELEHQRREVEQRQQREAAVNQYWQQRDAEVRQHRERSQAPREQRQVPRDQPRQERERVERAHEAVRAPRVEQRQPPAQREQRAERREVQQPQRSEAPRHSEPRSAPERRSENNSRHNRN